ncbi:MAG: carbohydrate ABC transporter permease [bacterium]
MAQETIAGSVAVESVFKPGLSWRKVLRGVLSHALLISLSAIFIIPFLWMVSTALKPPEQVVVFPPIWIPRPPVFYNFRIALTEFFPFWLYLKNTLLVCIGGVVGTLFSCSLTAYGFARIPWPGRNVVFIFVLSVLMIPYQVRMIPLFIIFKKLNWINTYRPLVVPNWFGVAFYIFLLRQFFMTIPMELTEAAKIDGCNEFMIFWRIILPLSKPALATVALFQWLAHWNDFLGPLIYISEKTKFTLSLGLQQFYGMHTGIRWELLMAASTVIVLPVIVLFFFTQRTFIQGIATTGLKE